MKITLAALPLASLLLASACSDVLDESKLKRRDPLWNEGLAISVFRNNLPRPIASLTPGQRPHLFEGVVCIGVDWKDPPAQFTSQLSGPGAPTVVPISRCKREKGEFQQIGTGREAWVINIHGVSCMDDQRCTVSVDGNHGGSRAWWKNESDGWRRVEGTEHMTWIS
ncbi:MAG: hypothetical protein M3Q19_04110 [Pseudomonadota bacterium]|nr:hypothetical protein [Pseudomonadota bacterium]